MPASLGGFQERVSIAREGLPYWILWLLLCIIFLLIAFIFLRDKDLRQRLSFFLSGAKRRVQRTQLQMRLNRAKRKRADLIRELGRLAWSSRTPLPKAEELGREIGDWESQQTLRQAELREAQDRALKLEKLREEARQKAKILPKPEGAGPRQEGPDFGEAGGAEKRLGQEIGETAKRIESLQGLLKHIESEKNLLFERLGALADQARPDTRELRPLYAQIDAANRNILSLMSQMETIA